MSEVEIVMCTKGSSRSRSGNETSIQEHLEKMEMNETSLRKNLEGDMIVSS